MRSFFVPLSRRPVFPIGSPASFRLPPRECAVDPTPAINLPALSSSTAPTPANTLEHYVGLQVAAAACAIMEALDERRHGALSPRTRMAGGDRIVALYQLRQFLIVDLPNFDSITREHGVAVLRAADVSPATAGVLVNEVLDLVAKVTRVALN